MGAWTWYTRCTAGILVPEPLIGAIEARSCQRTRRGVCIYPQNLCDNKMFHPTTWPQDEKKVSIVIAAKPKLEVLPLIQARYRALNITPLPG